MQFSFVIRADLATETTRAQLKNAFATLMRFATGTFRDVKDERLGGCYKMTRLSDPNEIFEIRSA
jgi:hypothetical protein